MIRYFAATDRTDVGLLALEYLKGFLRCHLPTRVASMTGPPDGRWEAYSVLLTTPLSGPFVNVVCCDPARWVWTQQVEMATVNVGRDLQENLVDRLIEPPLTIERATRRQELWTEGLHNVLITSWEALTSCTIDQLDAARKYDRVIIPSAPLPHPPRMIEIRVPVTDLPTLRDTLVRSDDGGRA